MPPGFRSVARRAPVTDPGVTLVQSHVSRSFVRTVIEPIKGRMKSVTGRFPGSPTKVVRRSARVFLVDQDERLLLIRSWWNYRHHELGSAWFTPGGGVDGQESLEQAAVRELREETGLVVPENLMGPVVAFTSGLDDWGEGPIRCRDDFFFHQTTTHEVDVSGLTDVERMHVIEYRWWPLGELPVIAEPVIPRQTADLVTQLVNGQWPERPVALSWT